MSANDHSSLATVPHNLPADAVSLGSGEVGTAANGASGRVYKGQSFSILAELVLPADLTEGELLFIPSADGPGVSLSLRNHATPADLFTTLWTEKGEWQAFIPTEHLEAGEPHLVILRYDGRRLDFIVDGLYLHLHGSPVGDTLLDLGKLRRFPPAVGEVIFWPRFLSAHEVDALSGGRTAVDARQQRLNERIEALRKRDRKIAARDAARPVHHFVPPVYWMNDPNGLVHWRGEFHVFYQHNRYGPYWGPMHWGHAKTRDFVHWEHLPIALHPGPGEYDSEGCFSGAIVIHEDQPLAFYTGVYPECQCLARGSGDLTAWEKHEGNPIIPLPPDGMETTGFRDPWIWRAGDGTWRMIIGSGLRGKGGFIPLYESDDLLNWKYKHPFITGSRERHGLVWECPGYIHLNGRDVLIFSPEPLGKVVWFAGQCEEERFAMESEGELDVGGNFYAPQMARLADGRWIVMGWLWEARGEAAQFESRWAGVLSHPREMYFDGKGRLCFRTIRELEALRGGSWSSGPITLVEGVTLESPRRGGEMEVELVADAGDATAVELVIASSRAERTVLRYTWETGELLVDRSQSTAATGPDRSSRHGTLQLDEGEPLRIRLLADRSVLEIFANDRLCLTTRIYPQEYEGTVYSVRAIGGPVALHHFQTWNLQGNGE